MTRRVLLILAAMTMLAIPATAWSGEAGGGSHEGAAATSGEHKEGAAGGGHEETLNPMDEFEYPAFGPELKFGPVDMSINKVVLYLWLAAAICVGWAVWQSRRMAVRPNKKQTFTELMYEFAHDSIAKSGLGPKVFSRYMPYVASLFMFLWVVNMISFLPLPQFGGHTCDLGPINGPCFALYAATSNINVTLALTLVTFFLTHFEGIRHNGVRGYFGSWAPEGNMLMKVGIWPLHALSELLRLVSLSVRLFANMLAGHLVILMMLGLIIIIGSYAVAIGTLPVAIAFFMFEVVLVASLQAYIFAMLSGIYIGFAAEPAH